MLSNIVSDKSLLIKGYSLINLYISNVLTEWIFFEMYCQVYREMAVVVTIFEELPMAVSKYYWNQSELYASIILHK